MIYEKNSIQCTQAQIYKDLRKEIDSPMLVVEMIRHVQKYTKGALSACAIKIKDRKMEDLLSYVSENGMDAIVINQNRQSNYGDFTVFAGIENRTIYGLDPQSDGDSPVNITFTKKLFQKKATPIPGSVAGDIIIVISDNKNLFTPYARCKKCRTDVVCVHPGPRIVEFALCSTCDILWPKK